MMPEKRSYPGEYRRIRDRQRIESERVSENPRQERIVSEGVLEMGSGNYWKRVRASTGEVSGRVPEKGPGEYRRRVWSSIGEGSGRVPEKGPGEYRKAVRESTEKGSG